MQFRRLIIAVVAVGLCATIWVAAGLDAHKGVLNDSEMTAIWGGETCSPDCTWEFASPNYGCDPPTTWNQFCHWEWRYGLRYCEGPKTEGWCAIHNNMCFGYAVPFVCSQWTTPDVCTDHSYQAWYCVPDLFPPYENCKPEPDDPGAIVTCGGTAYVCYLEIM